MNKLACLRRVGKVLKNIAISAFLLFWGIGMFVGGIYGMMAVLFGIPVVIGFTVFE